MNKKILGIGTGLSLGATAAMADLATDLATVTTAATDGVASVSTSQATVIASVFGLVLLAVGAKWIFGSIKSR